MKRKNENIISVFGSGQRFQHLTGPGPTDYGIILADFSIPEDEHALGELCDVKFVSHQHDR